LLLSIAAVLALSSTVYARARQDVSRPSPVNSAAQKSTTADLVKDVAKLLARHYPSQRDLHESADRLARNYAGALQTVRKEVKLLVAQASQRIDDLAIQQKLNLALELWRVRASLDLLSLMNPDTLHELTGLNLPDLSRLQKQVRDLKLWQ
jgi:hypothetical protein